MSCKPKQHLVESYMPYIYANYAAKNDLEILAVYKDSLYQVYFDVTLNRQYIKVNTNQKIYLIRK
jgi:hypothetical protein